MVVTGCRATIRRTQGASKVSAPLHRSERVCSAAEATHGGPAGEPQRCSRHSSARALISGSSTPSGRRSGHQRQSVRAVYRRVPPPSVCSSRLLPSFTYLRSPRSVNSVKENPFVRRKASQKLSRVLMLSFVGRHTVSAPTSSATVYVADSMFLSASADASVGMSGVAISPRRTVL